MARTRFSELSRGRKTLYGGATAVQLGLLSAALVDIRRRPAEQIHGPKRLWTAICFINFVGPISYFVFGRRR